MAAVAVDRAIIRKLGDLVHAVGNEDDRQPFFAQLPQHREDCGDVGGGQRRGRLVEDEELRIAGEGLGDLHHLAARKRQIADPIERMDIDRAHPRQRLLGEAPLGALVDHAPFLRRIGDPDVVRHGEIGQEGQLLEHADDPGPARRCRSREHDGLARELDRSGVGLHDARDHLDERGFARAVLPQDGVDAPARAFQPGVRQRADATVPLRDALQAE